MIDLSCHFLHGPDCGPASFAQSLELCRAAGLSGVRTIVMTPRWKAESTEPPIPLAQCAERIAELREALELAIDLKLGFMLPYSPALPQLVDRYGSVLALGGKQHLLICLPANEIPKNADNVWTELSRRNFEVVISQPASRPALRRRPEKVRAWVEKGIKLQVGAASVLGWHGREVKRAALEYIETYGDSVLLASNSHVGNGGIPSLQEAREEISKTFGERRADRCLRELPGAILGKSEMAKTATARTFAQRFSSLRIFTSW